MGILSDKFVPLALAASVLLPSMAMANPQDIQRKMDFVEKRYPNLGEDGSGGCVPPAARDHGGSIVFDFNENTSFAIKGSGKIELQWSMRTKRDSFQTCSGHGGVRGDLLEGWGKLKARM